MDAWEQIEATLRPEDPSPDKPTWQLIAEQERLRILDILKHRLNVYGVLHDS